MVETLEARTLLDGDNQAPQIDYLYLVQDTGLYGDDITSNPRVAGSFSDYDATGNQYIVELDVTGDSQADQSVTLSSSGSFEFNPTSLLTPGQSVAARVRVLEVVNAEGDPYLAPSTWSTLNFLYSGATDAGNAPNVDYLYLVNDTGMYGDMVTSDPRLSGNLSDPDQTGGSMVAELDVNGDSVVDQTLAVDSYGSFTFSPASLLTLDQVVTARIRGKETLATPIGDSVVTGAWSTLTFTYTAGSDAGDAPQIDYLYLVNDTGTYGDMVTSDPRLSGTLADPDQTGGTYVAQLDLNGDDVADQTVTVGSGGHFEFNPASLLTPGQTVTARVRGQETLTNAQGTSVSTGLWSTITFTFSAAGDAGEAPQIDYLYLVNDTGDYGDGVTTDARISGTLYDPDQTGGTYVAELDINNDGVIDQSVTVGSSGNFELNPASLLTTGQQVTARVRGRETLTNSVGTSSIAGSWSTLQFTYQGEGGGPTNPPPTNISGLKFTEDVPSGSVVTGRFGVGTNSSASTSAHALLKTSEQTVVDGATTTYSAIYHFSQQAVGPSWTYTRVTTDGVVTDEHWMGQAIPGWTWGPYDDFPVSMTLTPDPEGVFRTGSHWAHLYSVNSQTAVLLQPASPYTPNPDHYVAVIDWGDGTSGLGQVTHDTSGQSYSIQAYIVQGQHTYADQGEYEIRVQAFGPEFWATSGPFNYGETWTGEVDATVVLQTLSASLLQPAPVLGEEFQGAIATFTDSGSTLPASSYSAEIRWGDSGYSHGTIVANGQGGFQVLGTHTFYDAGAKTLQVRIRRTNGAEIVASGTINVAAAAPLTLTEEVTSDSVRLGRFAVYNGESNNGFAARALIRDAEQTEVDGNTTTYTAVFRYAHLGSTAPTWTYERITTAGVVTSETFTGYAIPGWGGMPGWDPPELTTFERNASDVFSSGFSEAHLRIVNDELVVLYEPTGPQWTNPSDYVAVIDWGDGTTTYGQLGYDTGSLYEGWSTFGVRGEHTYSTPGQYQITVQTFGPQILSLDGSSNHGETWTASVFATVVPQSLTAAIASFQPVNGQAFTGTVATFTDSAAGSTAADYTALISWGDGGESFGSVVADGQDGYRVQGTHTYQAAGNLPVAVRIQRHQGARLTITDSVHVLSVPPIYVFPGTPLIDVAVTRVPYKNLNWANTEAAPMTGAGYSEYGGPYFVYELGETVSATFYEYGYGEGAWIAFTITDPVTQTTWNEALTDADQDGIFVSAGQTLVARRNADGSQLHWIRIGTLEATIDWGDGATTPGTIQAANDGLTVTGSHTYTQPGAYELTATITGPEGSLWSEELPAAVQDVAVDDTYSGLHDRQWDVPGAQGVLANDPDRPPSSVPVVVQGPQHGTLSLSTNGAFTYTPHLHFVGTDQFTYRLQVAPGVYDEATVTLTVTNTAPTTATETYRVRPGQTLVADGVATRPAGVLANDSDADTDDLDAVLTTGPSHGVLSLEADGTFTYTPSSGYVGTDSFTYQVTDGIVTSAPVMVTLNVENHVPVATNDAYSVLHGRTLVADGLNGHPAGVRVNDTDADSDPLTVTLVTGPASGTVVLNSDGTFTYTPNGAFVGTDQFEYRIVDDYGGETTAIAAIAVTNQVPVAQDDKLQLLHDRQLIFDPRTNDVDADGEALIITVVSQALHGAVTTRSDGQLAYQPTAGYVGSDSFQYTVSDGLTTSTVVTVSLTITNLPLVAQSDDYVVSHDRTLQVAASTGAIRGVLFNDSDPDSDSLVASLAANVSHGVLTFHDDGGFAYTPAPGYVGVDNFTYIVTDGVFTSGPITVVIDVQNHVPEVAPRSLSAVTGLQTTFAVSELATDADGDDLTVSLDSQPSVGTLVLNSLGELDYWAPSSFQGNVTFSYRVSDGLSISNISWATITVDASRPVARNDQYSTPHTRPLTIDVVANDFDPEHDRLSAVQISQPAHGTAVLLSNGTILYTPNTDFSGTDFFTYSASDSSSAPSEAATVTIDVTNFAPKTWAHDALPLGDQHTSANIAAMISGGRVDIRRHRSSEGTEIRVYRC